MDRTVIGRFAILAAATLALAACGGEAATTPSDSTTTNAAAPSAAEVATETTSPSLTLGIIRPSGSIDPTEGLSKSAGYVQKPALIGLAKIGVDGTLSPELATEWSSNSDATEWTFKLREGEWTNGQPFTASDIVASLDLYLNPESVSPTVAGYSGILSYQNYEATDDHTIVFKLDRAYVDFPYVVAYGPALWVPQGYQPGQYEAGEVGGLGPFLLQSYNVDSGAEFTKNPNYWNAENINFDTLTFRFYDDEQSLALALQSGEVDVLPVVSNAAAVALQGSGVTLLESSGSSYFSLRMRNDTKPFDDVRVRQALALAIDRQAIVDTLYQGKADVANDHVFAPSFPQSAAVINAIPQRTQDIEKAKSLLAEAGYPDGIELTVTSEQYSDIPAYLQLVQSQVADAGITLNLDLKSQADYYGSVGNEPWLEVPLGSTDWGERATPSAMLATAYISGAPFNESKFDSKEFDAAVAAYDAETDPDKRAEAAIKAAQILHDEVPSIIAFFPKLLRASSSAVSGLPAGPISSIDLTGVAKQ